MKKVLALALLLAALPAAPAAAQPSPEHRQAARELLETMDVRTTVEATLDLAIRAQIDQRPEMAALEGTLREFLTRYLSWDALREGYIDLYAGAFTEAELREITAFYRSPVGQKVARSTPQLMAQGAALGERAVRDHMGELQEMVLRRLGEIEAENQP
jgi:uncharacterized protein